jgi:hypothetical protein
MMNDRDAVTQRAVPVWLALGLPCLLSVLILFVVWPGFMSWDSLHALDEARHGVSGGDYPPFVSYVWCPLDKIYPGPALMLFFQNTLLLVSLGWLLRSMGMGYRSFVACLILLTTFPPVLGPMLVVWKDVLMAACFTAAIASIVHETSLGENESWQWKWWLGLAAWLVFVGSAVRFNAVVAAIPLWWWMAFRAHARMHARLPVILSFLIMISVTALWLVNHYRLPDFSRLAPASYMSILKSFDLIGTSYFADQVLLPPTMYQQYPGYSAEDIARIYHPEHVNLCIAVYNKPPAGDARRYPHTELASSEEIDGAWRQAICHYPLAYFRHRLAVISQLVGLGTTHAFYATHYGVDANELGVKFVPGSLSEGVASYVLRTADLTLCRAWVLYLLGFITMALTLLWRVRGSQPPLIIAASGFIYLLCFLPVLPAADMRYNLYGLISVGVASLWMWALLVEHFQSQGLLVPEAAARGI